MFIERKMFSGVYIVSYTQIASFNGKINWLVERVNHKVIHIDVILIKQFIIQTISLILDIRLKIHYYFFHIYTFCWIRWCININRILFLKKEFVKPAFASFLLLFLLCGFQQFIINIRIIYVNLELSWSSRQQNITVFIKYILSYLIINHWVYYVCAESSAM